MKIDLNASVLFDIINNTRNPKMAMALIDGTYVPPQLPKTANIGKEQTLATFVSYDKWNDTVTYQLPNGEIDFMDHSVWMRASENIEDLTFVAPKDIKIMEAMATQMPNTPETED